MVYYNLLVEGARIAPFALFSPDHTVTLSEACAFPISNCVAISREFHKWLRLNIDSWSLGSDDDCNATISFSGADDLQKFRKSWCDQ